VTPADTLRRALLNAYAVQDAIAESLHGLDCPAAGEMRELRAATVRRARAPQRCEDCDGTSPHTAAFSVNGMRVCDRRLLAVLEAVLPNG
jgi:predicted RNA-binding Zn-ribbon protein involved in translation (DUF1610 family)